ncbi:hypothetical protein C8R44DRAFT_743928 [Mycena epipterygia]|nr:hypothetical protein C8R44DRAFT_743928 [Mycena epipterygia]
MSSSHSSSSSERPTLPPLHTLNLLPASYVRHCRGDSPYESYEHPSCPRLHVPQHSWSYNNRRVSTSSSSSTSRTPSPSPSATSSLGHSPSPTSPSKSNSKFTLVPSSFEDADAVIVIPPPGAPHVPGAQLGQGLLLTGAALEHLRHPQRQIAKGTRLHPYRFVGYGARTSSRRTSISSSASSA